MQACARSGRVDCCRIAEIEGVAALCDGDVDREQGGIFHAEEGQNGTSCIRDGDHHGGGGRRGQANGRMRVQSGQGGFLHQRLHLGQAQAAVGYQRAGAVAAGDKELGRVYLAVCATDPGHIVRRVVAARAEAPRDILRAAEGQQYPDEVHRAFRRNCAELIRFRREGRIDGGAQGARSGEGSELGAFGVRCALAQGLVGDPNPDGAHEAAADAKGAGVGGRGGGALVQRNAARQRCEPGRRNAAVRIAQLRQGLACCKRPKHGAAVRGIDLPQRALAGVGDATGGAHGRQQRRLGLRGRFGREGGREVEGADELRCARCQGRLTVRQERAGARDRNGNAIVVIRGHRGRIAVPNAHNVAHAVDDRDGHVGRIDGQSRTFNDVIRLRERERIARCHGGKADRGHIRLQAAFSAATAGQTKRTERDSAGEHST